MTNSQESSIRYRSNEPLISPGVAENLRTVLAEKYLSPGLWVDRFEERWQEACGVEHAVVVASGTAALLVALRAANVGVGDEVIVPALTCPDTLNAVSFAGARPVIVDVERSRYGLDPQQMADAITPSTKAVIPVHLYGCVVDPEVFTIAQDVGLLVIEDAAEAHGAELDGRLAGALGDLGCFSFRGDKMLGVGTGGAITTNNVEFAERARYLRGLGSPGGFDRYASTELGYSCQLSNVHAAIGLAQIDVLEETITAKQRIAAWYDELLCDALCDRPPMVPGHVWWKYSPLLKNVDTRAVHYGLLEDGIETMPPFTPMYRIPMFSDGHNASDFPVSEDIYRRMLSLPSSPYLRRVDVETIVDAIRRVMGTPD